MLSIAHWILRVFKKEHLLLTNYRRTHRHFFAFLTVDAILSVGLVTTGLHFFGPEAWASHENFMLTHPGVIPAPVDKFLDYATREKETSFWLGAVPSNLYTYQPNISGEEIVSYYVQKLNLPKGNVPTISVTTYRNPLVYEENSHRLLDTNTTQAKLSNGETVVFDTNSLKNEVITFNNRPTIVTIEYSKTHSLRQLMTDAANLKLLG